VCPAEAISLNESGVAEVDETRCLGCGACADACPQGIIRLHEGANPMVVKCSNRDPGKVARAACEVSCIGCGICEKVCSSGAAKVTDNLSAIDEELCLSCGMCAVKCPRHAIRDLRGILTSRS
ncbi:MAG: 4Fe-4S binding protein, partial [Clostridia bacterium]|nr:4Fe-4S binding protein [Clostridia bacterium]